MHPPRKPWNDFPPVLIHSSESIVKQHPDYQAAKSGDVLAAERLVSDTLNAQVVQSSRQQFQSFQPILASAHAYEQEGVNAIPEVLADELSQQMQWRSDHAIVQTNLVGHTGADGFGRLARQPAFDGLVIPGAHYVLVDDFIGMGGTLANLRGYIESQSGHVIGAIVLTGKPYSATLALSPERLHELRQKHGEALECWWQKRFGHTFDSLTESEARYLVRTPDIDTIRNRIAAQEQAGDL